MIMNEAARAKVDHLHLTSRIRLNQDVLRLQIAMDQPEPVNELQSCQYLLGDLLESSHVEVLLLLNFPVVLAVLVEIVSQKLGHDEEMLFVIEVVVELEEVFVIEVFTVGVDEA